MFKDAALKLAGLYLAVLMTICLFFSLVVYQISVQELDRGLRRPGLQLREPGLIRGGINALQEFQAQQIEQYELAKNRIVRNLLFINVFIMIGGGLLSYYLAKRTLQPIEEAHNAQDQFVADASHELRTPIAAMQSEIEVALMSPSLKLSEAKQILESNLEEIAKLTALSEGLLDLAKTKHGNVELKETKATTVVQDAINHVMPLAEQKSILLHNKIDDAVSIIADPAVLSEAIVILLDNAIKYSPEKSEVTVTASQKNKVASLHVTDNGVGIPPAEIPHIFERFYRADASRNKDKTPGYGVGLAIAKNIAELHQGKVDVKSVEDKGSTFTITVPLA